jgi:hypothetical protein
MSAATDREEIMRLLGEAVEAAEPDDEKRRKTQADEAADAMREAGELWHDEDNEPWMTFTRDDHREHWPLRSKAIRSLISLTYYQKMGRTLGAQARQDALARLEGSALFEGEQHSVFTRIAGAAGELWIDLADDAWRAIKITTAGWVVVDQPEVRFRRRRGMRALPEPVAGGSIEALRAFVNVASDDDWLMVIAFLVAALHDAGPFPVIEFTGEAGSAKSTACRVIRSLIDPATSPLRAEPREVRDLMIAARNAWVVAFDNVSHLQPWLSDSICRLATGGGFATRELYSNDDEMIFDAMRPVIINGIEALAERGDLADRSIVIALSPIADQDRRDEDTFWAEFEDARPGILGAFLDAVSGALRRLPDTRLTRMPRMADFARWVVAAAPELGLTADEFLAAYSRNRGAANEVTLESSPIAAIIVGLAEGEAWTGTATALLKLLESKTDEVTQRRKDFPKSTKALHGALVRLAPHLRQIGVDVDLDRRTPDKKRTRLILIRRGRDTSVQPAPTVRDDLELTDSSPPPLDTSPPASDGSVAGSRIQTDASGESDGSFPNSSNRVSTPNVASVSGLPPGWLEQDDRRRRETLAAARARRGERQR